MNDVTLSARPITTRPSTRRLAGRWLLTFAGFPIGGFTSSLVLGPVDSLAPALLGGLLTGAILGAVQAWGLGRHRPSPVAWAAATALGLMVGLAAGAAAVGYGTTLRDLVVQGAVTGLLVGLAQAVVLLPRLGAVALAWPLAVAAAWAAGWAVTTGFGINVDEQFTVFGSSGAIAVTLLTVVLPLSLNRASTTSRSAS